jgi:C_GCAxxG_C_C family probable redox protein
LEHQERAEALFKEGYNCAQSVFAAFSEDLGMDFETALKLSSSFGGGMGRLREVCGAVSGMFLIAGLKYGYSNPQDSDAKTEHYRLIQELAQKFKDQNGSIICRELLGLPKPEGSPIPEARTQSYYQNRPCVEIVKSAAQIIDKYLEEKQTMKIAVTTQGNQIFQHFGQCQNFTVFSIEDGKIQGKTAIDASQNGHAALAGFLKDAGVSVLICGGIGDGAKQMLSQTGIELVSGVEGKIEDAVNAYLTGSLTDQGGSCSHEDHGEDHDCSCENHCH